MKIAVLSDIHGNLPALQAVTADIDSWEPDQVIVNGDIVNRGPRSRDCLQFVLERQASDDWILLRGNHEDFVINCGKPAQHVSAGKFETRRFAVWTYDQLNGYMPLLETLPDMYQWFAPDGSEFRVVHASMDNNRWGVFQRTPDEELRKIIGAPPALFVTSHTHEALARKIDETLVVNVGSVGAPFDRDRRASYGRFGWTATGGWQAGIRRIPYDTAAIERDYVNSGFLAEAGPLAQLMLVELRRASGLFFRWGSKYEEAVATGHMSIEESVRRILAEEDVRPYTGPPGWDYQT